MKKTAIFSLFLLFSTGAQTTLAESQLQADAPEADASNTSNTSSSSPSNGTHEEPSYALPVASSDSMLTRAPFVFRPPVDRISITSRFGMRVHPIEGRLKMHKGTDFDGETGDSCFAVGPGRVTRAGVHPKLGRYVAVAHPNGFVALYGHLSEILVFPGAPVERGALVGLMGQTGAVTGSHLHFTLFHNGVLVDPMRRIGLSSDQPELQQNKSVVSMRSRGAIPVATLAMLAGVK